MKTLLITSLLSLVSSPLLASTAGRSDHSGVLVWFFLGICALIVVSQLIPALLIIWGAISGYKAPYVTSEKEQ